MTTQMLLNIIANGCWFYTMDVVNLAVVRFAVSLLACNVPSELKLKIEKHTNLYIWPALVYTVKPPIKERGQTSQQRTSRKTHSIENHL